MPTYVVQHFSLFFWLLQSSKTVVTPAQILSRSTFLPPGLSFLKLMPSPGKAQLGALLTDLQAKQISLKFV